MRLHMRYFAQAADKAGCREETIELPENAPQNLKAVLRDRHPALAPLLDCCRLAVNGEYAQTDDLPEDGAEVALIPPVSGG